MHNYPDPWADPKSRFTLRFYDLHDGSIGVQTWGFYVLDPPEGLDTNMILRYLIRWLCWEYGTKLMTEEGSLWKGHNGRPIRGCFRIIWVVVKTMVPFWVLL